MTKDRVRFLIVGTGRCGSSLLSAILAQAGANFDMPLRAEWDRRSGEYEHPLLLRAYKWYVRAEKISRSLLPSRIRDYYQHKMRKELDRLLKRATFIKSPELVHMVSTIVRLGYCPRIILVYRAFEGYAFSRHRKNNWDFRKLVEEYVNVNATALLQLQMFGGCVVSYEEIVNLEETAWAISLSEVTGLEPKAILKSRETLVQKAKTKNPPLNLSLLELDPRVLQIYELLSQLKARVIQPIG